MSYTQELLELQQLCCSCRCPAEIEVHEQLLPGRPHWEIALNNFEFLASVFLFAVPVKAKNNTVAIIMRFLDLDL